MYNWKLNDNQFSWLDRVRIASFFLKPNRFWSQGPEVRAFETRMAEFIGSKYSVFCSSGSSANTMIAMHAKDRLWNNGLKDTIVAPSIGWQTTYSPFIREGFKMKFIDISLSDFSMDLGLLEDYLKVNAEKVAMVFIVGLLGFTPNIHRLKAIENKYKVSIKLDNCENTFGYYYPNGDSIQYASSAFTSTTSYYMGHNIQACGEGGMIFTNDISEYEYFLMARNHGMTRSVSHLYGKHNPYLNSDVDPRFDFYLLGNNFRGTDVSAFVAGLDMNRAEKYIESRRNLYSYFKSMLNDRKYYLPESDYGKLSKHVPFCLPIVIKDNSNNLKEKATKLCDQIGIESRPVVSSNIGRHTCYKNLLRYSDFPIAEKLHKDAFYVGLHAKVKESQVIDLATELNKL